MGPAEHHPAALAMASIAVVQPQRQDIEPPVDMARRLGEAAAGRRDEVASGAVAGGVIGRRHPVARAARRVAGIATCLRIPPRSRIHQRTAGSAEARHNPNRRPWDVEE